MMSSIINGTNDLVTETVNVDDLMMTLLPALVSSENHTQNATIVETGFLDTVALEPLYFGVTLNILISIIGVLGNVTTIVAFLQCPHIKNATTTFIINLSVIDGMFCMVGPPLTAVTFINRKWIFPDKLCSVQGFIQFWNCTVSMFTMTAIAVNRYILISHPRAYVKIYTTRIMVFKIAILWIIGFFLWLPTALELWGKFGFDSKSGRCTALFTNPKVIPVFPFVASLLFIQALMIIFCYCRIFCIARKAKINLLRARKSSGSDEMSRMRTTSLAETLRNSVRNPRKLSTTSSDSLHYPSHHRRDSSSKKTEADMRILRISVIIVCVFILSFLPIVVVRMARLQEKAPFFYIFSYLSLSCSACINPFVYFFMNKEYRRAYKRLFSSRGKRSQKVSSSSTASSTI